MKKIQQVVLIAAISIFASSCEPNNDKGSTDQDNSNKEGAVDSSKMPGMDSVHSSH